MECIELLLESMPFAIWKTNEEGNLHIVNNEFCKLFKVNKEDILNKSEKEVIRQILSEKNKAKINKRIYFKNNKNINEYIIDNKIVEVHIINIKEKKCTLGIIIDTTERINWEKEVVKQKNMLKSIINAIPDIIFFKDKNSKFLGCNKVFEEIIGKNEEEIIGKGEEGLPYSEEEIENFYQKDREVMANAEVDITETKFIKSSCIKFFEDIKAPIWDENGQVAGVVGISRDITDRKLLEQKLTYLSYRDQLTGLYNRTFLKKVVEELKENEYESISVIMGDINGLKIVNDSLGHFEGDKFLIKIASIIDDVVRNKGITIRWGGDEIIIILPNMNEKQSLQIIEDINLRCKEENYKPVPLSISLGAASLKNKSQSIDDLILEAEKIVYKKKLFTNFVVKGEILKSIRESLECKKYIDKEKNEKIIELAKKLSNKIGLSNEKIKDVVLAVSFCDIGMIGIPDDIILKNAFKTKEEIDLIKTHSAKGYRIAMLDSKLAHISVDILTHHEKWDGSGYPLGLKAGDIPIAARIISLVYSYENFKNNKLNDKYPSREDAINYIKSESGKKFDPNLVKSFIDIIK